MSASPRTPEAPPLAAPSLETNRTTETNGSTLPGWMAPILLVTASAGIALMLRALWVCFGGNGPFDGQLNVTRFVDRATWWVMVGPGGAASWATLAALTAFTVVVFGRRRQHPAVPDRLRLVATCLAGLLLLLELSGPLTVAAGWFQLSLARTAGTSFWDHDLVNAPQLMLCLVLAVLAALIAWVLRGGSPDPDEPPLSEPNGAGATTPWADEDMVNVDLEVVVVEAVAEDHSELYRRPTR